MATSHRHHFFFITQTKSYPIDPVQGWSLRVYLHGGGCFITNVPWIFYCYEQQVYFWLPEHCQPYPETYFVGEEDCEHFAYRRKSKDRNISFQVKNWALNKSLHNVYFSHSSAIMYSRVLVQQRSCPQKFKSHISI